MFDNIHADVLRYHRSADPLRAMHLVRLVSGNFGLQALFVYRFGQWLLSQRRHRLRWLGACLLYPAYALLAVWVRLAYGIALEQTAVIGPGLYIGHFGAIRVANCRIAERCSIQQHVNIGPARGPGPLISSRVWIGAHATITLPVTVGEGATIGAGAVVTQDVPPDCLILGNPGRVTQRNYDNSTIL